jgi:phosphomannomutase
MEKAIPSCFKAYDIRDKVPDDLDPRLAKAIGRGLVDLFNLKNVVIGRDVRLSGEEIMTSCIEGMLERGCDVQSIGLCGTEEMYHAVFSMEEKGVDGGIIITASHNPAEYNGMKIVLTGARPLSGDTGLHRLGKYVVEPVEKTPAIKTGQCTQLSLRKQYIEHVLGYIDIKKLAALKIVANCGNGCAGPVLNVLEKRLPCEIIKLNSEADGSFPHGVPNPLLVENRQITSQAVIDNKADMGIAWDGDFDRCFFWDERGEFVEGYYIVGLLAREMLSQNKGERILHDPRLIWNTIEQVEGSGGIAVMTKTGHAFIKERMRAENALYGGEMSAHHYFRDFGFCDSGMIPWLLVASLLSKQGQPLSALVGDMIAAYPVSGEINSVVGDADAVIKKIESIYSDGEKDYTDGLSIAYDEYRFNIRKSNTEPVLRLNVESRGDKSLMEQKTAELLDVIGE